eukprot:PhM_4_TR1738/c0_g1_i1/m.86944/K03178/UBE1, UBA1; ubiquitin-activating enzyme E1
MATPPIDSKFLDLYSRQIGTYGMDTMVRLISLKVLILGCRGVAAEAAKNLALAGVHTVAVYDNTACSEIDRATNFCITHDHVKQGKSRAEATAQLVDQLNPNTRVRVVTDINPDTIHEFDIVIATCGLKGFGLVELTRVNEMCRSRRPVPTSFLVGCNLGVNGSIFVDHCEGFVTKDDGREALQKSIDEVDHRVDKKGRAYTRLRVSVPAGLNPGAFLDNAAITFSDVKGFIHTETGVSINNCKKSFVAVHARGDAPNTLRVYPSLQKEGYGLYQGGGFVTEVKQHTTRDFRPFAECVSVPPAIIITDSMMDGTAESNVHLALTAVLRFLDTHAGTWPTSESDVSDCLAIAHTIVKKGKEMRAATPTRTIAPEERDPLDEMPLAPPLPHPPQPFTMDYVDDDFLRRAFVLCSHEFQPMTTIVGALLAQEVVKVTGRYTPIHQFLHLNGSACLPDEQPTDATAGVSDRNKPLRAMFGQAFVDKIQNLHMFMVGCGALGCEYMKNIALMGIACGPRGLLTVTDNDLIEVSNLNRQFLFREENIGQAKSIAAAQRGKSINPSLNIDARKDLVGEKTEHLFTDEFWMGLDVVTNALDNMTARLYVDDRCTLFEKILVEAGTTGTGGNVDIIVPHKTSTYAEGGKADESGGIPMCTLRNFPYIFDHCIEWARAQFDDLFVAPIMLTQQLREDPARFKTKLLDEVKSQASLGLKRSIVAKNITKLRALQKIGKVLTQSEVSMGDCVFMAWTTFHAQFRDRIASLIKVLPVDARRRDGEPFWSGHRKFPTVLNADLFDADTRDFLISAANLYACMLGVHGAKHPPVQNDPSKRWKAEFRTEEWLRAAVSKLEVPEIALSAVDDLDEENDSSANDGGSGDEDAQQEVLFEELLTSVVSLGGSMSSSKAQSLDFEKDDDDNFHIDFITAAATLRARNYDITTKDRMTVKLTAGRIIPAIATTTAAVTGFALMELFKVLQGKDTTHLRNGQIDLGANTYVMFERDAPRKVISYVKKTYDPETDYTMEEPIVAWPDPHTAFDKLPFDVTSMTTVYEFVRAFEERSAAAKEGPYSILSLGVGTGLLWNGTHHRNTNCSLLEVIAQQEGAESTEAFWSYRRVFHRLVVTADSKDGSEVVPATIVLRIQH